MWSQKAAALKLFAEPIQKLWQGLVLYHQNRRNSELEQAVVRILIGLLLMYYFEYVNDNIKVSTPQITLDLRLVVAFFLGASLSICASIFLKPGEAPLRRTFAILMDTGALTLVLTVGGVHAAPLYFLYLWIIIGNGFRFGQKYLLISLLFAQIGFGIVVSVEPYWSAERNLSIGLWLGTLLISVYCNLLVGRLFTALEQANSANLAKRHFICAVSHELRTPLNAIIGMVDLLKSTPVDREQREMLDCMTTTSQLMLSQIEDVLDFSKIEAGKMGVEHIQFDLYALIENITRVFSYRLDPNAVRLSRQIDCAIPPMLHGDPHHIRQILINLLGNAIKFTEQGSITLKVKMRTCRADSMVLHFSIEDTGIGIPEAVQGQIFESFTQADSATARKYGGTGLGTTICKQLVELMGGRIGLRSRPGVGSEFWFELTLARVLEIDDTCLIGQGQSMIIDAEGASGRLAHELASLGKVLPRTVQDLSAAELILDQARMQGTPISMIFLRTGKKNYQGEQSLHAWLSDTVQHLIRQSADRSIIVVLVPAPDLPIDDARRMAEQLAFFAVLPDSFEPDHLRHLLHAQSAATSHENRSRFVPPVDPPSFTLAGGLNPAGMAVTEQKNSLSILIVEDNPTNRTVLRKILERAGHCCVMANDGEAALDIITTQQFDAMVIDMNMPKLSGLEVVRFCRMMGGILANTPIIVFSASVTQEARDESFAAGADAFIPKPIEVQKFLHTLNQLARNGPHDMGAHRVQELDKLSSPKKSNSVNATSVTYVWEDLSKVAPILDITKLNNLKVMSQDAAFVYQLIEEFINEGKRLIDIISHSLARHNYSQLASAIHALRGSALSIGAEALKQLCTYLEKLTDDAFAADQEEIQQVLETCFHQLSQHLSDYQYQLLQQQPQVT